MVHNAFHHEHSHGRVFHGLEARDMLQAEKRGEPIKGHPIQLDNKMRFIHNAPQAAAAKDGSPVETVYAQVYVTETATGPGPVVGYSTATAETKNGGGAAGTKLSPQESYLSAKSLAQAPNTAKPSSSSSTSELNTKPTQRTRTTQQVGVPTQRTRESAVVSSSTSVKQTAVVGKPQTRTREPSNVVGSPLSATSGPNNVISEKSDGMSGGAKAGLAFGIIIAIALAAGLVFFCWRRRKQQASRDGAEALDEKRATKDSFFGGTTAAATRGPQRESIQSEKSFQTTRTAATAPRLSLRPVTQFLPNILTGEKNQNNANSLGVPAMSEKSRSNPFDDSAASRPVSPANDPFADGDAAIAAAGKTTPGHSQQNSWEGSEPPTPKSTKFGTAAAVPISSQAPRGPNNVHRVQLDFKPSMEDELELRSGQLVRMLHEYDDGWALCIRLDRSQQGVCPRTCLSKLPVKPRPQGPPPPNGPPGRPMGPPPPGMRRPASPQINGNMVPRPLTPTGRERSHTMGRNSPGPHSPAGRPRSQSMGGMERPTTPNSMPARKPVPGMAL